MDIAFYEEIVNRLARGKATVLLTVVQAEGSVPRGAGAKMLVGLNGVVAGTIGGGNFEHEMVTKAAAVLQTGRPALLEYADRQDQGLACGGSYLVFAEPLTMPKRLFILGCGHVGRALARLAEGCGYQVLLFDDRPASGDTAGQYVEVADNEDPFAGYDPRSGDALVIAGRSHSVDLQALRAALRKSFSFIGLLGSSRKKKQFFELLEREGVSEETLARIYTPVGLDIGARTPEEIAVAIMAQLIAANRQNPCV